MSPHAPPSLTLLPSRAQGVRRLGSVITLSLLAGLFGYQAMTSPRPTLWGLAVLNAVFALAILPSAFRLLRQSRPILTADSQGIAAAPMLSHISRLAWPEVAGVETWADGKTTYLVITGLSEDAPAPGLSRFMTALRKGHNKKSRLPGLLYIPATNLDLPLDLAHIEQAAEV